MKMSVQPERLLVTAREAAEMLGISTRSLWTLTNSKTILSVRIGRAVRYSTDDLKAFIDSAKNENRTSRVSIGRNA